MRFSIEKPPPVMDPVLKRMEYLTATTVLARLPANEEKRLLEPLVPPTGKKLWYVRPENYLVFDPLAFALELMGELTVSDQLPTGDQWKALDGIVMVGLRAGIQLIVPAELAERAAAAGRPQLPFLALVSQGVTETVADTVLLRSYPVSLKDLKSWLAGLD